MNRKWAMNFAVLFAPLSSRLHLTDSELRLSDFKTTTGKTFLSVQNTKWGGINICVNIFFFLYSKKKSSRAPPTIFFLPREPSCNCHADAKATAALESWKNVHTTRRPSKRNRNAKNATKACLSENRVLPPLSKLLDVLELWRQDSVGGDHRLTFNQTKNVTIVGTFGPRRDEWSDKREQKGTTCGSCTQTG